MPVPIETEGKTQNEYVSGGKWFLLLNSKSSNPRRAAAGVYSQAIEPHLLRIEAPLVNVFDTSSEAVGLHQLRTPLFAHVL